VAGQFVVPIVGFPAIGTAREHSWMRQYELSPRLSRDSEQSTGGLAETLR